MWELRMVKQKKKIKLAEVYIANDGTVMSICNKHFSLTSDSIAEFHKKLKELYRAVEKPIVSIDNGNSKQQGNL